MSETIVEKINRLISHNKLIHFIGIGGIGMSAIARIMLEKNYKVSGTDLKESINTSRLKDFGAKIYYGHSQSNIREAGIVVISSAIQPDNPELIAAINHKIPIFRRAEMLDFLMCQFNKKISVAGTHGKTTTTSMITRILDYAHMTPTYLIGGDMNDFGGNAALGKSDYFVAESDESDGSFLCLEPNIGVVTNIEEEHMNYFKTTENLLTHFSQFIQGIINRDGYVVLNKDNAYIFEISKKIPNDKIIFYSLNEKTAELSADKIIYSPNGVQYMLLINGQPCGQVMLQVYGIHNVYNSLAAIAIALREGLPLDKIKNGISKFSGTKRRFQFIGEIENIRIYDDYGHHPTEVAATLKGAKKSLEKRIFCVFQPHRYSRTLDLVDSFAEAFSSADEVIISEIYAANEPNPHNISAKIITEKMAEKQIKNSRFIEKKSAIVDTLLKELKSGDAVITMGAGDIHTVAKELFVRLKQKYQLSDNTSESDTTLPIKPRPI